jgi:RecJ-like exonuclease
MSSGTSQLLEAAKTIAERITAAEFENVIIVSHIDADGLTAASIASSALQRLELVHEVKFVKQLDEAVVAELEQIISKQKSKNHSLIWFTDLGSGMVKSVSKLNPIITDHHAPSILDYEVPIKARMDLMEFSSVLEHQMEDFHLNPHLYNLDGTYDISGAGTVYLVARAMNPNNKDLAQLAVIGAIGDLQDSRYRQLVGTNRKILEDAQTAEVIKIVTDISSFGRETRTLPNLIRYSTDPYFPGLTMNEANCIKFLKKLEIPIKSEGKFRHWVELEDSERKIILSELMELMLSKGIGHKDAKRLLAEVYLLPSETVATPLHDAKEFATLLNSCGKYNKPEVGYKICLGDRGEQLNNALHLLKGHRGVLIEGMQFVKDAGITDHGIIQYFDANNKIPENVVGTIAGMLLGNGEADINRPLFGFVLVEDGSAVKVSGRTTRELVNKGVDLSRVMAQISKAFGSGSVGGGHDIAAGATIPLDKKDEFLANAEQIIRTQLGM